MPIGGDVQPGPTQTAAIITRVRTSNPAATRLPSQSQASERQPALTQTPAATPPVQPSSVDVTEGKSTATSALAAVCPDIRGRAVPTPAFLEVELPDPGRVFVELDGMILDYLNAYGPAPILQAYGAIPHEDEADPRFLLEDLTNDGVPELIARPLSNNVYFAIYGCRGGTYQNLLNLPPDDAYFRTPSIVSITDENQNDLPEMTLLMGGNTGGGHWYRMYEWDGSRFRSLIQPTGTRDPFPGEVFVNTTGTVHFQQVRRQRLKELVVMSGIPLGNATAWGIPYRNTTSYYRWNGDQYEFVESVLDPPQYRFQAVQDADRLTLQGEYDQALALYQQAIYDKGLDWWSEERRDFLIEKDWGAGQGAPPPTPPAIDTAEYYNLAAYARFRIMLLHVLRGQTSAAHTVYESLQNLFPVGTRGHAYAELAAAFWNDYEATSDIQSACTEAFSFALGHRAEILQSLGSDYHGEQSRIYHAEDVCPFL